MSAMDVTETLLPGVGIRYEFETRAHQRVGVIMYRDGRTEVVTYSGDDPDASTGLVVLDKDEAEVVSELLGAPRFTQKWADLTREIPGLVSEQVRVPENSAYVGRRLGSTRARTRTGSSIVAIVRSEQVITSPDPSQELQANDLLVVIGTRSGVEAVRGIVAESY